MIRKKYRLVLWLAIALAMLSCVRAVEEGTGRFAIYLVADSTLTLAEADTMGLDALPLEEIPFLTENDITAYSWSNHVVSVTPEVTSRLVEMGIKYIRPRGPEAPPMRTGDLLFVVTVGKERVYLGTFWPMVRSVMPGVPHVMIPVAPSTDSFRIGLPGIPGIEDHRPDERIRQSLINAGLLRD